MSMLMNPIPFMDEGIGRLRTPFLLLLDSSATTRRPFISSILSILLSSSLLRADLNLWCDSRLHSESLVSGMRVSGLLGCLSSEVDSLAPFPKFGRDKVDQDHTKDDSPFPS
jgi:hypothetical protein